MIHFKYIEFDSPDLPGSGKEFMSCVFLALLDKARSEAGIPFKITSGFRTPEYNDQLKSRGYPTSIHVDLSTTKIQDIVWIY